MDTRFPVTTYRYIRHKGIDQQGGAFSVQKTALLNKNKKRMINVIWYDGQRGRWDHGLLLSIFDKHPDIFIQYNEVLPPKETKRSIVVVAGCPSPERLYGYLSTLPDSVVILVSDEEAYLS